ncbi:FAD-binding oxidoreductase [Streptomyces flavofungini]|uniref:FAD-binding oxidoreductase n=1 Tax=Streptomyces flavofungini TaxID=68200 RepID=A0ABS0XDS0_9ACTN|nr:FAD-binding oxidoreductase [Streptomyces flavofungini]MBJ3811378.1 FAD-binding oxidoreductase [Streptomyces flavofungini]
MDTAQPATPLAFRPGQDGYEDELAGFQTGYAQRPDVVFAVAGTDEVVAAVAYAAERGLPVGVEATGHGRPDASRGGVLISTRRLDEVVVDPVARTARVGAGVRWGQVVAAAAQHGLAPLNGSAPSVGAVSYTLGGGLGILAREFGYAADHVRALDVVTADGAVRHVTAESDPELFWGLLGGGANLGVVTSLEFGLVPVARLYGGALAFDGREVDPAAILRAYTAWAETVPDEVSSSLAALVYPDLPMLPEALRGRYLVTVHVAYTGTAADGERLVAPLRAIGPAHDDSLRELPYTENHTIHSDPDFPHAYYGENRMLDALDTAGLERVLSLTGPAADRMHVVHLKHLGGALARPAANAVPHRDARWLLSILAPLNGTGGTEDTDGSDRERLRELYAGLFGAVAPGAVGRALNFTFAGGDRTEGLYDAETRKRLAGLKATYDPANLFRRNYNVR